MNNGSINQEGETSKKYPFMYQLHPATIKLYEALKGGVPGDVFTDERLLEICGRETGSGCEGTGNLITAIRKCEKEIGVVWRRERQAGCIRCLNDEGKCNVVESARHQIARKAKRNVKIANLVDINKLPENMAKTIKAEIAVMGAIALMGTNSTQKKLAEREPKPLQTKNILQMFTDK